MIKIFFMSPLDSEGRRLEIDFFLGDLRRRLRQIHSGTVVHFYQDDFLNEPPMKNVLLNIDDYTPEEIVNSLTPLLQQVENIDNKVLNMYTKELSDFQDISPYEMIFREISAYNEELRKTLDQYKSQLSPNPSNNPVVQIKVPNDKYKYEYFINPGSERQLKRFRDALLPFIDEITDQAFLNIFSGTENEAPRKINWKGRQKNLCAYFIVEISRIMGFPKGDHIWLVASKYITFDGQRITTKFRTNYKPNKVETLRGKSEIDNALEILSSPPAAY